MAVYQIVEIGADVLREKAKDVKEVTPNIVKLLDNMLDTMYEADGVGLAAPQIGISKRVVVIDVGEGPVEFINPVIVAQEGEDDDSEGCLSIPGVTGEVVRAAKVTVEGLNRQGELQRVEATGFFARACQHEIDHLEGILFVDKAHKTHRAR
ncbi:peptide deformylase [Desulfitobacterium metallireducens]|uniref:Peptide deformylase n=1 Tax=Desulfitobacterium metallireducens DSM 15288 TaxID=871968 RepID=W0EEK8_9FIRM|nr:peptide deformylase [Desulfitobacterium metallireducens]AHF07644.1 peptide deformylase [Desulfitobacterium metallireducens DSM 15288]